MPIYKPTVTVDTTAYSTGDVIGGKIALPATNGGLLAMLSVFDDDNEGVQLDFFFFDSDLTGTSGYTDNAAFAVNASDKSKLIGVTSAVVAGYFAAGSDKVGTTAPVNIVLPPGVCYLIIVIRSTTTFTATTDLKLVLGVV